MFYFVKSSWLLKKFYKDCIWNIDVDRDVLYLTFDDGPHPTATAFVLDVLKEYNAQATFFCIGKNVKENPELYKRILSEGHRVGNHTFNHLNGWKTPDKIYIDDIIHANEYIDSNLFRPPYGRITKFQQKVLSSNEAGKKKFKIIMWDVLSGDFDTSISGEKCSANVLRYAQKGSIVTFHDSEKAFPRMKVALTDTVRFFIEKGFRFEAIPL
jgi:peptidoglycan/xylan/chitin deacetylase (PgdA/CDA1 family)